MECLFAVSRLTRRVDDVERLLCVGGSNVKNPMLVIGFVIQGFFAALRHVRQEHHVVRFPALGGVGRRDADVRRNSTKPNATPSGNTFMASKVASHAISSGKLSAGAASGDATRMFP